MIANRSLSPLLRSPLVWIFVFALVVRLILFFRYTDTPLLVPRGDDMKFYNDWALRILRGEFIDGKAFYGMPGYAWILAGLYKMGGFNPFIPGFVQVCLEAGTAALIFALGRHFFAPLRVDSRICEENYASIVGALAALGWIFFLPAQSFSIILMPTAYLLFAFWGLVLWIAKTRSATPRRPWAVMGLVIGLVAMVIATILFLIPLAMAQIVRVVGRDETSFRCWRQRIVAAVLLMAGVFAGTSPAWIHNYFIAGEPVMLSAHSGLNLYIGNNEQASGYPKIPPGMRASQDGMLKDSITEAERAVGRPLKRFEVSQYWSHRAKTWISQNRGDWLRLMGVKVRNFWNAYSYDDLSIVKILRADGILPPGLTFGIVAAFSLPGLIFGMFALPRTRWVAAGVLLHLCALLSVFITERYRMCAVPGMLLFGALFLVQVWLWLLAKRWLAAAAAMAVCGASAWAVSVRSTDMGNWSLDPYNMGVDSYEKALDTEAAGDRELRKKELDRSLESLELSRAYVPDGTEINFALGNTWLALGNREKARNFYARTLKLKPGHASAWNNLGVMALEDRKWKVAAGFLENAVKLEPGDAKALYLLARAQAGQGDRAAARETLQRALKLRPEQSEFLEFKAELEEPAQAPGKGE